MSRTSLHMPRPPRAVWLRPATGTRLLPSLFPPTVPLHTPHYKRCPKALRLRLRSDQSPPRPLHGRSPDKSRHALTSGHCQVRAPLTRRIRFASSGDALEHSVMSPPWAIAPPPDSPGLDLAGESEQSDNLRLKTNAPFRDSTVVTIGELRSTNAGHGSTLPSLRMVEHFWWSRLPHTEISSRLLHILSEARGCRRAGVDVEHPLWRTSPIGTGVAVFLRNRPGPSIPSLSSAHPVEDAPWREQRRRVERIEALTKATTTQESNRNLPCPSLPHRRLPHPRKMAENFPGEQSYRHELSIESIKSPHQDNPLPLVTRAPCAPTPHPHILSHAMHPKPNPAVPTPTSGDFFWNNQSLCLSQRFNQNSFPSQRSLKWS